MPAKKKILLVDDEPDVISTLISLLGKEEKYELAVASDGFEAGIQIMTSCPDLVVLDLMMPQMDGFQVCRRIKSTPSTEHIKVLVLTGYATDENIQKALECGADYCMEKPIKGDELRGKVEELIANRIMSLAGCLNACI
jgi:CheY-like chemotaxis protein